MNSMMKYKKAINQCNVPTLKTASNRIKESHVLIHTEAILNDFIFLDYECRS